MVTISARPGVRNLLALLGLTLLLVACAPDSTSEVTSTVVPAGDAVPTNVAPDATAPSTVEVSPTNAPPPAEEVPADIARQFSTDFTRRLISFDEVLSGGPPKDGIPAIDDPMFVSTTEADEWVEDLEPVAVLQENDEVRIYPFQILTWHEIVNDEVGGRPVAVTFCPLCNTAIAFDATAGGMQLYFGTRGRLRFSNLLMYDRHT